MTRSKTTTAVLATKLEPSSKIVLPAEPEPWRLTLRHLTSDDDYARCEALQQATWGEGFPELASTTMMKISQKVGGLAAGAFDPDGVLRGLIFGITGQRGGEPAHWSHITAVEGSLQGLGLGRHLKAFQRRFLLELGVEKAFWTYDPLVARNAHLNINRLGAEPVEYHEDFYGDGGTNALHRGLGTDRFIVEWRLEAPQVERALSAGSAASTAPSVLSPVVNASETGDPLDTRPPELLDVPEVWIEVPLDIQTTKQETPELAVRWRRASRWAFQSYMAGEYRVTGFRRQGHRGFYLLQRSSRPS